MKVTKDTKKRGLDDKDIGRDVPGLVLMVSNFIKEPDIFHLLFLPFPAHQ